MLRSCIRLPGGRRIGAHRVRRRSGESAAASAAALAGAVGPLSASAQGRAERALARRVPPVPIDIAAAEAELGALLKGQGNG